MIDITAFLQPELIDSRMKAKTKEEAIRHLAHRLFETRPASFGRVSEEEAVRALIERESLQSTGLGNRLAFPHARIPGWKEFAISIGVSENGIDFHSPDKQPVHWVCLMISPEEEPYAILQTMAAFSRYIHQQSGTLEHIREVSPQQIILDFQKLNVKASNLILAQDIMRPVKVFVELDAPIEQVAHTMHLNHTDDLPVVDENKKFYGMINCSDIFSYGIPDFFKQLHTVSFVRHIDPFEKYYKLRKTLKVRDLIKQDHSATISGEDTLLEIIFQLTVKNKPRLFILDDGKLMGEIDRFSIVDKILFF